MKKVTIGTVKSFVDRLVKEAIQQEAPRMIDRSVDVDSIPDEYEQDPHEFLRTLTFDQLFDGTAFKALVAKFDLDREEASALIRTTIQQESPNPNGEWSSSWQMFPRDPQHPHPMDADD